MPSPFYPSSLVLFQLHGGMVSHMQTVLQVVEAHPLFPYFLEKRLAIPASPFFHLLVNDFSVTCLSPFF